LRWGWIALVALVAIPVVLAATDYVMELRYEKSMGQPEVVGKRIAILVPGFACDRLEVTAVLSPIARANYEGGSMLRMPDTCRQDLLARLPASRLEPSDSRDDCFGRQSRQGAIEFCFEGKEVYFGNLRPG
jgi:hypothetical protein